PHFPGRLVGGGLAPAIRVIHGSICDLADSDRARGCEQGARRLLAGLHCHFAVALCAKSIWGNRALSAAGILAGYIVPRLRVASLQRPQVLDSGRRDDRFAFVTSNSLDAGASADAGIFGRVVFSNFSAEFKRGADSGHGSGALSVS